PLPRAVLRVALGRALASVSTGSPPSWRCDGSALLRQRADPHVLIALRGRAFLVPRLAGLAARRPGTLRIAERVGDVADLGAAPGRALAGLARRHRGRAEANQTRIAHVDELARIAVGPQLARGIGRTRPVVVDRVACRTVGAVLLDRVARRHAQDEHAIAADRTVAAGILAVGVVRRSH